jgi:tRNA-Thr(GGU) m(6)t(6)A37 methyltransferase TsaA
MIVMSPIAHVSNARTAPDDDHWGPVVSEIRLVESLTAEALEGIEEFTHVEILYLFDRVHVEEIEHESRHPRENPDWPKVGIFAQRSKNRPNRIGTCVAEVVLHNGKTLTVRGLDAIDGTPVLDIKPVFAEFLPRGSVRQPQWSRELMRSYWVPE